MISEAAKEQTLAEQQLEGFVDKFQLMQVLILVEYLFMCGMCFTLVLYLRHNRHIALAGDASAARKVLLPAFEPLLWLLGCTTGGYALVMMLLVTLDWIRDSYSAFLLEIFYSMRLFVFGLVFVFLLQKSVSFPALRRSVAITLVMASYTLPIQLLLSANVEPDAPCLAFVVMSAVRAFMLAPFVYVSIRPPARASKRTLREYSLFVFTYFALHFGSGLCFQMDELDAGFVLTYATVLWAIISLVVIWRVLKADTEFWRGLGKRAVDLQTLFCQRHSIDERISSQGLHVLIEMHRKLIIDFAHLKLQSKIGTGASAVVFNGLLHPETPVAIKVYTPTTFSEETVAEFSQEAALCGALHHPNVVKFYGMCVYPPTICLVSELCQGTLGDITCATRIRFAAGDPRHRNRQQMLLNLSYMLDAARAVAYLHSFSPPFLHRDIKPANFLVDVRGTVKLTDFGESRSLARSQSLPPMSATGDSTRVDDSVSCGTLSTLSLPREARMPLPSGPKMTVKGTVDYMAPEIINGKAGLAAYGEAADVYSLAMTMWDVLHPGVEKFPTLKNNHLQVFAFVVEGKRPPLELGNGDGELHPSLREVIEAAWHANPRSRPSAQSIVTVLERIQEELFAVFAAELLPEMRHDMSASMCTKTRGGTAHLFPGELIVARMQDMKYVQSPCEAVRLGSAFMDAGLLHHQKHARCFENAAFNYFFDEDNIRLCQPLDSYKHSVVLDTDRYGSDLDDDLEHQLARFGLTDSLHFLSSPTCSLSDDQSSVQNNPTGSRLFGHSTGTRSELLALPNGKGGVSVDGASDCRCRKLGQRLGQPRAARRGRLRRKFKPSVTEESVLTARLLEADVGILTPTELALGDTLDGFSFVGPDVRAA
ncbi:hypothetical protein BBJ28_00001661 [Nothophytophthora sp. Chile5]|nr:hypothetical protein BBJ28_00001661 [Nothophytophthora sp. Chile5]